MGSGLRWRGSSAALVWLVLCGLLLASSPARALTENRKKGEEAFLEGVKAFKAEKFEEAARQFEVALEADRHPVLLYNLAVAYDRLGDVPKAVKYYKAYLKTSPPDEEFLRLRLGQIDAAALAGLDAEIEAERAAAAAGASGAEPGEDAPEVPEVQESGGGGLARVSGLTWAVLGLGVVGLGAGGVFGAMSQGAVSDFDSATLRSDAQDAKDRAESNALLANVGFGVGAVAIVGGAVLLVSNLMSDDAPAAAGDGGDAAGAPAAPGWRLAPLFGPQGGGLSLEGTF